MFTGSLFHGFGNIFEYIRQTKVNDQSTQTMVHKQQLDDVEEHEADVKCQA